jgi:predicted MFS family arabinose efflux permease
VFSLVQLPVGLLFDRFGVRLPTATLMAIGTVSAVVLSITSNATVAIIAQAGMGVGCAPIFMGLLNHVLRTGHGHRNVRAVTTASAIGMAGALLAAYPLSRATASFGWRPVMATAAFAMLCATLSVLHFVRRSDSVAPPRKAGKAKEARASANGPTRFWTLMPACLALSVGSTFRTSWGGPYLADVFGFDVIARGNAMTVTSMVAIVASFCVPVAVRYWAPKTISSAWLLAGLAAALLLALNPGGSAVLSVALICVLFSVGSIHPLVMSQARAIIPPHRLGLSLGLLNSMVFLGIALTSNCFGWITGHARAAGLSNPALYSRLFLFTAVPLALGTVIYRFSPTAQTHQDGA